MARHHKDERLKVLLDDGATNHSKAGDQNADQRSDMEKTVMSGLSKTVGSYIHRQVQLIESGLDQTLIVSRTYTGNMTSYSK
jgi:hypothetical protein